VLLVPTNASSYRDSQVPAQEVAVARLRALETGRWVVHAAPTGYSAVIDQRGRVRTRGGLGGAEVLRADIDLRTGRTLFVSWGPAPWLVLALLAVMRKPERRSSRFVDRKRRRA
jgi:apolipoprotein N-acyltransferase